jgi:DNA-directed RNA polymerase beta subunit
MSSFNIGNVPLLPTSGKPVPGINRNVNTAMDIESSKTGEILTKYLGEYGFGKFTIEGYNEFADERLGMILKAFRKDYQTPEGVRYAYTMELDEFSKPRDERNGDPITPKIARDNLMSYTGEVMCKLTKNRVDYTTGVELLKPMEQVIVKLCEIPVMIGTSKCHTISMDDVDKLKSGECPTDPGGSFVIEGNQRILLLQEMLRRNTHFIHLNRHSIPYVSYLSDEINATNLIEIYISSQTRVNSKEKKVPKETHLYRGKASEGTLLIYLGKLSTVTSLIAAFRILLSHYHPNSTDEEIRREIMNYIEPFIPMSSYSNVLSFMGKSFTQAFILKKEELYYQFIKDYNEHKRDDDKLPIDTSYGYIAGLINGALFPNYDISDSAFFIRKLPNGGEYNYRKLAKLYHLGFFVVTVILAKMGKKSITNRDHWPEKCTRPPATTIEDKVRRLYNKVIANVKVSPDINDMKESIKSTGHNMITQFLIRAFRNNSWSPKTTQDANRENISAILEYLNLNNYIAKLTEIAPPMDRRAKTLVRLRKDSEWGFIGLNDTPDGDTCGLTKHLAITAETSSFVLYNTRELYLLYAIYDAGIVPSYINIDSPSRMPMFMNGRYMGFVADGYAAKNVIRGIKLSRYEFRHVSVTVRDNILFVDSSRDRPVRPLFRVGSDGMPLFVKELGCSCSLSDWNSCTKCNEAWRDLSFRQLIERGYVEYLDPSESEMYPDVLIATDAKDIISRFEQRDKLISDIRKLSKEIETTKELLNSKPVGDRELPTIQAGLLSNVKLLGIFQAKYNDAVKATMVTHMEIHPSTFFSYAENTPVFPERNTGPRNQFYCGMTKQKVTVVSSNVESRMGGKTRSLISGSRPLVETIIGDRMYRDLPSGNTMTIAVGTFRGLNQEDGIVMAERLARRYDISGYIVQTEHLSTITKGDNYTEIFGNPMNYPIYKPDSDMAKRFAAIDDNGKPRLNSYLTTGDCVVGKVKIITDGKETTYQDVSEYLDTTDEGRVVDVRLGTKQSQAFTRVKLRETRRILPGEKLTTRQAQKTTIAAIRRDMPYSKITGREVDVIINPHCMSRMTIGLLIEILLGIPVDNRINGQAYEYLDINSVLRALPRYGFVEQDKTILIDPATGEEIVSPMFVGQIYMELLKHHPYGKIQSTGPRVQGAGGHKRAVKPLTRAPSGGSRKSGLRIGDMERDAIEGNNSPNILRNLITERTDEYTSKVCLECGSFVLLTMMQTKLRCTVCGNQDESKIDTYSRSFVLNTGHFQFLDAGILNKPIFTQNE